MDIDINLTRKKLVKFIRDFISNANLDSAVFGLSGGIDSCVVAYLCVEAVGPDKVHALCLPYYENKEDALNSKLVADKLDIEYKVFDISGLVNLYFDNFPDADQVRQGNMMARQRMNILFDHSKIYNGVVVGTGNKSELLLGYFTLFGDGACSCAPIADLYKTQVCQLAKDLGVPDQIINKKPSAGLWPGQTDEEELGISYDELDKILYLLEDKKYNIDELLSQGFDEGLIKKIMERIESSSFKRKLPATIKI